MSLLRIVLGSALFFGTFAYMGWQGWKAEQEARRRREWERNLAFLRSAMKTFPSLQVAMVGVGGAAIKAAAEFDRMMLAFKVEQYVGLGITKPPPGGITSV